MLPMVTNPFVVASFHLKAIFRWTTAVEEWSNITADVHSAWDWLSEYYWGGGFNMSAFHTKELFMNGKCMCHCRSVFQNSRISIVCKRASFSISAHSKLAVVLSNHSRHNFQLISFKKTFCSWWGGVFRTDFWKTVYQHFHKKKAKCKFTIAVS